MLSNIKSYFITSLLVKIKRQFQTSKRKSMFQKMLDPKFIKCNDSN